MEENEIDKALKDTFVDQNDFEEAEGEINRLISKQKTGGYKYVQCIQKSTKRPIICKIYNPELFSNYEMYSNPDQSQQASYQQLKLIREVVNLKKINHPTIASFIGFNLYNKKINFFNEDQFQTKNAKYSYNPTIYLEYIQNGPLQNWINTEKQNLFDVTKRQICMIGLASALKTLHSNNIIHRGLSPKSIWLDSNFYPKVFDFNSSRAFDPKVDASLTMTEEDKEIYQAHEFRVESGEVSYTSSIDIYSLGRIFYIMATGYEPFKLKDFKVAQSRRTNAELKFPPTMPKKIRELIENCCEYNPYERPTATQIYNKLTTFLKDYLVDSKVNLTEVQKYIESIESYERRFNLSKVKIRKTFSCHIPEFDPNLQEAEQDQLSLLYKLIASNFTMYSTDESLRLLLELAKNNLIYQSNCLNMVSDYVNTASKNGNDLANEFLKIVFGDFIVDSNVTEIKQDTITDKNITTANIPLSVKKICKKAFKNFKKLERINIPQSVESIEEGAFQGCTKLSVVNIPSSIKGKNLGNSAFTNCKSLKYIFIPPSIKKINDKTFKNNEKLTDVILSDGLEEIGKDAFLKCSSLKFIEIPETVKKIDSGAFIDCTSLTQVLLKAPNPTIKYNAIQSHVQKLI